jgi:hypothetical protein
MRHADRLKGVAKRKPAAGRGRAAGFVRAHQSGGGGEALELFDDPEMGSTRLGVKGTRNKNPTLLDHLKSSAIYISPTV